MTPPFARTVGWQPTAQARSWKWARPSSRRQPMRERMVAAATRHAPPAMYAQGVHEIAAGRSSDRQKMPIAIDAMPAIALQDVTAYPQREAPAGRAGPGPHRCMGA